MAEVHPASSVCLLLVSTVHLSVCNPSQGVPFGSVTWYWICSSLEARALVASLYRCALDCTRNQFDFPIGHGSGPRVSGR